MVIETGGVLVVDVAPADKVFGCEYVHSFARSHQCIVVIPNSVSVIRVVRSYLIIYIAWDKYGIAMHQSELLHDACARNPSFFCSPAVGGDVRFVNG